MPQKDLVPGEIKLSGAGHPCDRLGLTVWRRGGWTDGQEGPLPRQEARAAAELNEQLPFTEPVGLHHLTERLVSVAARVVGDARVPQQREARLTPAAVSAGAFAAQAALVTPSAHFVGQARHLLWIETFATG